MLTVNKVSKITGVSIRTLQYYDNIGLLPASAVTEAGYRMYDDTALERLQQIMLFKELDFSLKEIKRIIEKPDFDSGKAIEQQIDLLKIRRERLDNLIELACEIKKIGVNSINFKAFDNKKAEEYKAKAKESWGKTDAYKEFEQKDYNRSNEEKQKLSIEMMEIFREFGKVKNESTESTQAIALVNKLQKHICDNYYDCTDQILLCLGEMYVGNNEFTENIDKAGGEGTAAFVNNAIKAKIANK